MEHHNVAVIGLGRVGAVFLERLLTRDLPGLNIVAVCDIAPTQGRRLAEEYGVPAKSIDELVDMGDQVDILFELTGNPQVRLDLRNRYFNARNTHTVILPEIVARMIWGLMGGGELPDVHAPQPVY